MALIKTAGAELKKFWANDDPQFWPTNSYVDGMYYEVNGVEKEDVDVDQLEDTDIVKVEGALIHDNGDDFDFSGVMKKWRKSLSTTIVMVEVDLSKVDELKAALKSFGAKIIK